MNYEEKYIPNIKKTYENVYHSKRVLSWCKLEKVNNDFEVDEKIYRQMMKDIFRRQQKELFDFLVKYYWLAQKFIYNGRLRSKFRGNGWPLDRAFGVYLKCYVGFNNHLVSKSYTKLFSYFDDFFPNLMAENPFEKKMKFPYRHMNFECLYLVSDIPERLELLKYGEKKKMGFGQFNDFVYNYICTINEQSAEPIFKIVLSFSSGNPHIIYVRKQNKIKTSDICSGV